MASELNVGSLVTTGNVGVGGTPTSKLSIEDTSGIVGMNIKSASDNVAYIYFGNASDLDIGGINYNSVDDTLNLRSGNANRLSITAGGVATFTQRVHATGGVSFGQTDTAATGAAATSSTLDHYEEGTWTPVLGGGSCTNVVGKYTRVGNKVTVTVSVYNGEKTGASDNQITGLPFTVGTTRSMTSVVGFINLFATANPAGIVVEGTTRIDFISNNASASWSGASFVNSTATYLHFSATYFV